ncbi:nucleotide exchange factor GrpE [Phormidium tenue FACHB-886]|nr:nucleotide exchange factor GrpE [Phormidium tenue FACHB-886]
MNEEKRLDPFQDFQSQFVAKPSSSTVERMESEPMSAETNLPIDSDPKPEEVTAQVTDAVPENFTLEPDVEPFDLSPDMSAPAVNTEASTQATPQAAGSQAAIAELNQAIDSLKAQLEERSTQYMRLAADFENFRKRTQKEKEEQEQQVKCSTVKELLPVVDNFERARTQLKPQTDAEMVIHKSYQGVYRQLVDAMKKLGVSAMNAEGQEFDPNLHEAVLREPTDAYAEGVVMEELMRGYVLGERVLRHAMVKVAAAPEFTTVSEPEETIS